VRSIDIVNKLEYTRPSVSIAMKKLRESGFIEVDCDGYITLTKEGQIIAESIYEKHVIICRFLKHLGVDSDTAFNDACKIEHVISEQSFLAIKRHVEEP
jgi:Mn-dependent DtxR family transcriptional regulator